MPPSSSHYLEASEEREDVVPMPAKRRSPDKIKAVEKKDHEGRRRMILTASGSKDRSESCR